MANEKVLEHVASLQYPEMGNCRGGLVAVCR